MPMFESTSQKPGKLNSAIDSAELYYHDYSVWSKENPKTAATVDTLAGAALLAVASISARTFGKFAKNSLLEKTTICEKALANSLNDTRPKIIIGPLKSQDEAQWKTLYNAYATGYGKTNPAASSSAWSWLNGAKPKMEGLIARSAEGKLVGLINFRPIPQALEGNYSGYIEDLYVAPSDRGRGVASKLLSVAAESAKENGWKSLTWITAENNPARNLYAKLAVTSDCSIYQLKADIFHDAAPNQATAGNIVLEKVGIQNITLWQNVFRNYHEEVRSARISDTVLSKSQSFLTDYEHSLEGLIARTPSGEPIGFVHFRGFPRPLYGGAYGGNINDLYVIPSWRKNGIGTEMVSAVSKVAKDREWNTVRWNVPNLNSTMLAFSDRLALVVRRAGYDMHLDSDKICHHLERS